MKQKLIIILAILLPIVFGVTQCRRADEYKKKYETEAQNVVILTQGQKDYKIKDSIQASTINALTLSEKEFRALYQDTYKELKYLKEHPKKEIEYVTKFETKTETLWKDKIDTVYINGDTCQYYADAYTNVMICKDSVKVENIDILNQYISKHYKHKFLWWRWKMDGITQDIYNENPNSKIIFDQFIKIQK